MPATTAPADPEQPLRVAFHPDLTVGGNWQFEKLRSADPYFGVSDGWRMYPRAGRRQEGEGYLVLDWRRWISP